MGRQIIIAKKYAQKNRLYIYFYAFRLFFLQNCNNALTACILIEYFTFYKISLLCLLRFYSNTIYIGLYLSLIHIQMCIRDSYTNASKTKTTKHKIPSTHNTINTSHSHTTTHTHTKSPIHSENTNTKQHTEQPIPSKNISIIQTQTQTNITKQVFTN